MPQPHAIAADILCFNYQIDYTFIKQLNEFGLIETNEEAETIYIPEDQLPVLEKLVRMHREMDINLEGIETISYLLQRIKNMQQEIMQLRNRLNIYES